MQNHQNFKARYADFWKRHARWLPVVFFVLGFVYDVLSLSDIDSGMNLAKQAAFLLIIGSLIGFDLLAFAGKFIAPQRLSRIWRYQDELAHFLLGSLLSEFALFFFKSASLSSSFVFMLFLGALILFNEFKRFSGSPGVAVRSALFGLCLAAYFSLLVPVVTGFVGYFPFMISMSLAGLMLVPFRTWLERSLPPELVSRQITAPIAGILAVFSLLYFAKLIPPVPVSIQYLGIFHEIRKDAGAYLLSYDEVGGSYFQMGSKKFFARPGDKPHAFARIYAPARFNDQIQMRWMYKSTRDGWKTADIIRVPITGGRELGFRGYTTKSNFEAGDWQVRVETTDDRELGRVYFEIKKNQDESPRQMREDRQ